MHCGGAIVFGQILDGFVKILICESFHLILVAATFLQCLRDSLCALHVGDIAVVADQLGVFACAAEVCLSGIAVELGFTHIPRRLVIVGEKGVGAGYEFVILLPQAVYLPLLSVHGAVEHCAVASGITVLLAVGEIVGPLLGAFQRLVPVSEDIEFTYSHIEFHLGGIPGFAVSLREGSDVHAFA